MRTLAVAGGVDAGRDLGAVEVVVAVVVRRVVAGTRDDVAAVAHADVAARLHFDAGDIAAVNRNRAAVGQIHAAFAAGHVDAERLRTRRVADHAVVVLDLQEARRDDRDVAAVVDRRADIALRFDARRPGVAVDLDGTGVGHVHVRARREDAVGQTVVGNGGDVGGVVDRGIAEGRIGVDADRAAEDRTGVQVGTGLVGDVDVALAAVAADGGDIGEQVEFGDRVGVVDDHVAAAVLVDRQCGDHRDRCGCGTFVDDGQVGDRGAVDAPGDGAVARDGGGRLAVACERAAAGTQRECGDRSGQGHAHGTGHGRDLDLAGAPRGDRTARMLHAAHITPKVRRAVNAVIRPGNPCRPVPQEPTRSRRFDGCSLARGTPLP